MTRALLTAATIGTLTGLALTFGPHGAVGIAVCAFVVILLWRGRDVRTWPVKRCGICSQVIRAERWGLADGRTPVHSRCFELHGWSPGKRPSAPVEPGPLANLKPWPIGDDEVRRGL